MVTFEMDYANALPTLALYVFNLLDAYNVWPVTYRAVEKESSFPFDNVALIHQRLNATAGDWA